MTNNIFCSYIICIIGCKFVTSACFPCFIFLTKNFSPSIVNLKILKTMMILIQINTFHNNFIGCSREWFKRDFQANIYLFKVNNRNTRKRCELCSKLT